jgi:hypothetical protein
MAFDDELAAIAEEDPLAALLWPWLLTSLDDWGRGSASPKRLKRLLFSAFANITEQTIDTALSLYARYGLIRYYTVDGHSYWCVPVDKWYRYQTHIRRDKRGSDRSRYPAPPEDREDARNGAHMRADATGDAGAREDARNGAEDCASPSTPPPFHPSTPLPFHPSTHEGATRRERGRGQASPGAPSSVNGYDAGFLEFWRVYPRKVDKGLAWKAWQARIHEGYSSADLIAAARHYAEAQAGKDKQYIKHARTFLGPSKPFLEWVSGIPPDESDKDAIPRAWRTLREYLAEGGDVTHDEGGDSQDLGGDLSSIPNG